MVPEMVDLLMRLQVEMVEYVIDLVPLYPQDVPVVRLHFLIPLLPKGVQNTVSKGSLEPDGSVVGVIVLLLDVLAEVFRHLNNN